MFRSLIVISFLFLYLIAMLRPVAPVIDYLVNKDYIKTVLCINKDVPEMHCDGKCYLKKKLKKASDGNTSKTKTTPNTIKFSDYPIGFVKLFRSVNHMISKKTINKYGYLSQIYSYQFMYSPFQPPEII